MAGNPFTEHPHEIGETYPVHFGTATMFGLQMVAGGLAVLIHAIFPFLFEQTGSRMMERLHRHMTGRVGRIEWERYPII